MSGAQFSKNSLITLRLVSNICPQSPVVFTIVVNWLSRSISSLGLNMRPNTRTISSDWSIDFVQARNGAMSSAKSIFA